VNYLYYGDNLDVLRDHIADESIDLIYIDPPFNSKRNYNIIYDGSTAQAEAFKDTWSLKSWQEERELIFHEEPQRYKRLHKLIEGLETLRINADPSLFGYLVNMSIRIVELHRVLKPTGSLYLHCDPTASHYLKIMLDDIFGKSNYQNELIWCYAGRELSKNRWNRKHDVILFYTKSNQWTFNWDAVSSPLTESSRQALSQYVDEQGKPYIIRYKKGGGFAPSDKDGSSDTYRQYVPEGVPARDWLYCDYERKNKRLGYPTQKPEALLTRIIAASSNENDVVLDAFCGCGTTITASEKLGRKWIGIDITYLAIDLIKQRLLDHFYRDVLKLNETDALTQFERDVTIGGIPKDIEGVYHLATQIKGDRIRKEYEKWAVFNVGGVYSEVKGADSGFDGYFYLDDIDEQGKYRRVKGLVQAKSGKVGVAHIRDFAHVIEREGAVMGIFVTLENPTGQMFQEISRLGKWNSGLNKTYDKVYIVTAQDILDGVLPNLPIRRGTKQAKPARKGGEQNNIGI